MLQFFKRLMLVAALAFVCQGALGFSLLGPRDTWQLNTLGYDPRSAGEDLGGPKNLGEEWRWTLPTITYGYDASFIDFFGTNGIAAIESAINLYNRDLTNSLMAMTDADLRKRPLNVRRIHSTAQSLGLLDLKSEAMGLLAEQLGLADSERYTWAIRARAVRANITNYTIIKRNFDPFTLQPSSFVNGQRLSYQITQFPLLFFSADWEDAVEVPLDQAGTIQGSTVSSLVGTPFLANPLRNGEYITALSQDDVGGLRYIYRANNVNSETVLSAQTDVRGLGQFPPVVIAVDTNQLFFTNGIDALTFFTNAMFTNNLLGQFTNLQILSTNISVTNIVTTTFTVTNIGAGGLFTNTALPTLITNQDLFTFSEASRTNNANQLRFLYPQLIITKTNSSFVQEVQPFFFLTNSPYGSPGDPPVVMSILVTNLVPNYSYQYGNVVTNYASATSTVEIRDIQRASFSTPQDLFFSTNVTRVTATIPSGGFYILDRSTNVNLVAYALSNEFNVPLLRITNIFQATNIVYRFTNIFDPADIHERDTVNFFTNVVYAAYPILINSSSGQLTIPVLTTNQVVRFDYTFGTNLLVFPPANGNSNVFLQTISFVNGQFQPVITTPVDLGVPQGTVLILDTNQFVLAGPRIETFGLATNVVVSFTNAATGDFITQLLIYQTNSIRFAVFPVVLTSPTTPMLRAGVDSIRFVHQNAFDFLSASNSFSTNTYTVTAVTNHVSYVQTFRRVAGPDILFAAADIGVTADPVPFAYSRNLNFQAGNTIIGGGAAGGTATFNGGPGEIAPGVTITFNKLSPGFFNSTPGAVDESTAFLVLSWGSFDSKTVVPIVYPQDITGQLKTLEDIVLRRNP
jgi:hypothetical protein